MFLLIKCNSFNTIMCTDKAIALVEHNLYKFVVTIFVFGHKYNLLVHIVGTTTNADGANI